MASLKGLFSETLLHGIVFFFLQPKSLATLSSAREGEEETRPRQFAVQLSCPAQEVPTDGKDDIHRQAVAKELPFRFRQHGIQAIDEEVGIVLGDTHRWLDA